MTKSFSSFADFAKHLGTLAIVEAETVSLREIGVIVKEHAKQKLGKYQPAASPFAAWRELSESTKAQRVAAGYSENEPLFREGDLCESIEYKVKFPTVHIGSDSDIAVYQELGTANIPPRSFLGSALVEQTPTIVEAVGKNVFIAMKGDKIVRKR